MGALLTRYKLEYYKPDVQGWIQVDYFVHEGQPVYLGRDVGMNLYIPPIMYAPGAIPIPGEDFSEAGKELFVVTQDVLDYADDTPDLHRLQVRITFTGEDNNEDEVELVGYVDIKFSR